MERITNDLVKKLESSRENPGYNKALGDLLDSKKVTLPPWNQYITPVTKHFKPIFTKIVTKLGFEEESYKNYFYFSIKEWLKLSKNNVVIIPDIGDVFIHRTIKNKNYQGDRRLRPDICLTIINRILLHLNQENLRFFETYYCDKDLLAIEYIENPLSLYKKIYKEKGDEKNLLDNYYKDLCIKIKDFCKDKLGEPLWGPVYHYDDEYNLVLDLGADNFLYEEGGNNLQPNLILMDIFYLQEK